MAPVASLVVSVADIASVDIVPVVGIAVSDTVPVVGIEVARVAVAARK